MPDYIKYFFHGSVTSKTKKTHPEKVKYVEEDKISEIKVSFINL
jgi:hypothetical protein